MDGACAANQSLVCVGLDVDPDKMPIPDVADFNAAIVDATAGLVCCYKPNLAFYEALGIPGLKALEVTIAHIRQAAPQAIIIGDAKRGDIGNSGTAYAHAMFQVWDFDAVTVNAWGGRDTVEPFLTQPGRGVFVWCRGSNPGSSDLQDLSVSTPHGNMPQYQHLAREVKTWSAANNLGLVVGATVPDQLKAVRDICPNMPILIPGVGAQGGALESAVQQGAASNGRRAIINSSRGIIYASQGPNFAQAAGREAAKLRDAINTILDAEGKGWP
ncbi:MAG: orotidine-5'-phosphate decarboxylase [SAR202 cluster bacterium Io17-Chloro-G2]|nr:MAG: orotidine-5'-phosphate decarboxylase [SAR202 cluster bacterium Io17-Chloro-G2]